MKVDCPYCESPCEVYGSFREFEVWCDDCGLNITDEVYEDIEADWIADRADRAMDEIKDREMGI